MGKIVMTLPDEFSRTMNVEIQQNNEITTHKTITVEDFFEMVLKNSLEEFQTGLLPHNCVNYLRGKQRQVVFLHFKCCYMNITYEKTRYEDFPIPDLVFAVVCTSGLRVEKCKLTVVEQGILSPKSKLFHYPFSNVNGYDICVGANPFPEYKSLHTMATLPYYILSQPNNDDYFRNIYNRVKYGYRELLEHLKDKNCGYYYRHILVPKNKVLADFFKEAAA